MAATIPDKIARKMIDETGATLQDDASEPIEIGIYVNLTNRLRQVFDLMPPLQYGQFLRDAADLGINLGATVHELGGAEAVPLEDVMRSIFVNTMLDHIKRFLAQVD